MAVFRKISYSWLILLAQHESHEIGIPNERKTVDDIGKVTIDSDRVIGETIFIMEIRCIPDRRKRQYSAESDHIRLYNVSSHFGLKFNNNSEHELFVKSCLSAGLNETLHLKMDESVHSGNCQDYFLTVLVEPVTPVLIGDSAEVYVDQCADPGTEIDVLQLLFNATGTCEKRWNCTANCTNDDKLFWVYEDAVIRSYVGGTDFNKTFNVLVTCFEYGAIEPTLSNNNTHTYSVLINGNTSSCTSTMMMTQTASTAFANHEEGSKAFLEYPANVAVVSTVGGLATGAALGAGLYKITKKKCTAKPETTRKNKVMAAGDENIA